MDMIYLDNAATTQKPREVLDAISTYYTSQNANVHRGVHLLSERATLAFEQAREHVAAFFGAARSHEIVFTRNATESVNLVASSWGGANLQPGDEVMKDGKRYVMGKDGILRDPATGLPYRGSGTASGGVKPPPDVPEPDYGPGAGTGSAVPSTTAPRRPRPRQPTSWPMTSPPPLAPKACRNPPR